MIKLVRLFISGSSLILTVLFIAPSASAQVFSFKWGSPGNGEGQFIQPAGIAVDSGVTEYFVYVTDLSNNRIQKFDSNGTFIKQWGSGGNADGQFSGPEGIGIDFSNNVYVADWGNNRVQKFDSDGTFITQWASTSPYGIGIDSEFIGGVTEYFVYVTDYSNHRVRKFDSNGTFITQWASPGQFTNPRAIAVDSLHNIYVTDSNSRVQKFDNSGGFLSSWGSAGTGDGQFIDLMGISIDSSGNVLVTEDVNARVQKFDGNGAFITKWGIFGLEDGQFRWAYGVAVHPTGRIYVVDREKNQIQVFTPPLPPSHDGTGTYHYSLTNNRIIDQFGAVCIPESVQQTGTATVTQTGQNIRIVTSAGDEFTGFVSGSDINASTTSPNLEFGGFDSGEILATLPSTTGGSGILRYSWNQPNQAYCTGEADLTLTKPIPSSGGGGGGGGCFIGAAFN